ncbi:MAG TPA: TolC family protein [Pirellulales bacterium]|nr:TolC family protein [Pirellulales bacterium]
MSAPKPRNLPVGHLGRAALIALVAIGPARAEGDKSGSQSAPVAAATESGPRRLPQTAGRPSSRRVEGVQVSAADRPMNMTAQIRPIPEPIPPGRAEPDTGITLEDVTNLALANNPQIREAAGKAAAARAQALQASLYPNPTFGQASPQLAGNQTQYNGYIIQDIVTKNKIGLDTAAAERAAREAELALVRARFDVLTRVRQSFYTALVAQQRVEVLERMVKIAETSLDISQRLLKAEVGTRGDVLLLQIEYSRSSAELQNAITLAETSRRQLAASTGLFDMAIPRVQGDVRQALPEYEVIAVQQGVISRNALVRSAQIEIARNQILLRRAQVEPFPNINVMGGYQNQLPGAFAPESQGIYQVQIVVPLWNRNQGNIRAAAANIGVAGAQLNRVENELANTTAQALGRYLTAKQLAERYERIILPSAVELQDISAQLYNQSQIDFLRYLNAQRALLDANLAYLGAQESRWTAAAEVAGLLQSERFP